MLIFFFWLHGPKVVYHVHFRADERFCELKTINVDFFSGHQRRHYHSTASRVEYSTSGHPPLSHAGVARVTPVMHSVTQRRCFSVPAEMRPARGRCSSQTFGRTVSHQLGPQPSAPFLTGRAQVAARSAAPPCAAAALTA